MCKRAHEIGQTAVALTDHGNMFGMLHFAKAAKKVGIKPIFGMEAYVAPTRRDVKEKIEGIPPAFHICLFAMNDIGLKNLFKLSSLAYTEGFYYKPRIDDELLSTYNEGLIVSSACLKGKIQWYLMQQAQAETEANADGWLQMAYDEAGKMKDMLGDRFYIELQRGMKEHEQILPWQIIIAKKFDIPCIVTSDAHYSSREDSKFHEQIVCLSTGKTINDEDRLIFSTDTLFLHSEAEAREQFPEWPEAIDNTQLLADRCNVTLPEHYDYVFPVYGDDDVEEFKREARAGLAQKGLDTDTRYVERLEYEIDTIVDMGFPSYFLVVADYIRWAREQGIAVGPGRGSAAGSVVAWVLGITTVDSIEYGLLFQRFLNKGRKEMPDIDVDFCQDRRGEVIEYLTRRYGAGKVAQIATFAGFKPRGAVRDFCRVQGEPYALGEKASKLIPAAIRGKEPTWEKTLKESPGLRSDDFNDIINMAQKSEGLIKQAGMHPAGVAIAPVDILNHCPVFLGKKKELVCQWNMKQVEQIGLVKMDILGLSNLTIIDTCLRLVKATRGEDIDILDIPMDDPEAYDVVCKGDVSGLFQLEGGGGIQELSMKLKPRSVGEIAAISALYRPGPLDSGTADEYVARAQGHNEVVYLVPELEPILKETYGLLIYQEQAMQIATDLGSYTLEEADDLRKAIGKKIQEKMDEQEEKLLAGMQARGISEDKSREIWETIKVFADYGFNKSHAVAYSIITYQTAWLKAHYPAEFYCALMTIRYKDRPKVMEYLRDCRKADIQVLAPDVNESKVGFTVIQGVVRFGLSAIKGIGEKIAKKIALEREKNGPFGDIFAFYARTGVTRNVMEVLAMAGALGSLDIGRAGVLEILDDLVGHKTQIAKYEKKLVTYEKKLEAVRERATLRAELQEQGEKKSKIPNALKEPEKPIQPLNVAIPECEELDLDELLALEYETLGIYVTGHPLYAYEQEIMGKSNAHTASLGDGGKGEHIRVVGVVNHVKNITTRKGAKMAVIILEDLHGTIEVTVFSRLYADVSQKLEEGRVLLVGGRVDSVDENLHKIIATGIEDLTKKRARRPGRGKEPKEAKLIITEPSEELLQQMADIITASPGQCVLTVVLQLGRYEYTLDKPATVSSKALASFKTLGGTRITIR